MQIAPWFSRIVLLIAGIVLALIGRKFVSDPIGAAEASTMTLNSALAVTNMRASFGAFPLGCAIFTLVCLVAPAKRMTGLYFVATVIGTALLVRVYGVFTDGTFSESARVLGAETVLLVASILAIFAENAWRIKSSPAVAS